MGITAGKSKTTRLPRWVLCAYSWLNLFLDPFRLLSVVRLFRYMKDWFTYSRMEDAEPIYVLDTYPCLRDGLSTSPFDRHYFYQDIWAFHHIVDKHVESHIDIGSNVVFVGMLTTVTRVLFIDIRPLTATLERFSSVGGSILQLPFPDNSVPSLSCLHVAEHIGLGRYGDPLDPQGTLKAAEELSRVLAPGGNLYFSVPVGRPRVCFNAHRVLDPTRVLDYFRGLELVEFSGIDDERNFQRNVQPTSLKNSEYACGLFWFRKPER